MTPPVQWKAAPHPNIDGGWTILNTKSQSWASTCFASKASAEAAAAHRNREELSKVPETTRFRKRAIIAGPNGTGIDR